MKSLALQAIASRLLLGFPKNEILSSQDYKNTLPKLEKLYKKTWRWHGTGRYHYHEGKVIDVLKEIIKRDGLIPHKDPLDYTRGDVYTISLSGSRAYSALYAQLHYEKGKNFRNSLHTTVSWFYYVFGIVAAAIHYDKRLFSKKFRDKHKLNHEGRAFFRDKYTQTPVTLKDYLNGGVSDIKGNYPIIVGIKKGAFREANIAKVYSKHESRSETQIPVSAFTHIEVPMARVAEVKSLLLKNKISVTIIPIEFGEEYSK